MPPKKDAKKGGEAEPELGPEEMLLRSKLRIESLERELVARSEAMNKAVAEQMKMRQKVAEFHQDFVKEKQDTFAITSDMTRQYKQMQEDLLRRNNEQQLQIEDLKDQVQLFSLGFCCHVNRRSIFIKSAQTLSPTLVFDAMKSRKTK
jgi:hypothetical protein